MKSQILLIYFVLYLVLLTRAEIIEPDSSEHLEDEYTEIHKRSNIITNKIENEDLLSCTNRSIFMARQFLAHQLKSIKPFNTYWFNDLDRNELLEEQRASLSSVVMSNDKRDSEQFLHSVGQPTFEIESSYFRPHGWSERFHNVANGDHHAHLSGVNIELMRQYKDKCHLDREKNEFVYRFAIIVGPFEHNIDATYHIPKKYQLSQPIDWHYAQIRISVNRMMYEIELHQKANWNLIDQCPTRVTDVTYIQAKHSRPFESLVVNGIVSTNETGPMKLDRFFDDYTRPAVSGRVKQLLRFYLNDKTLPLEN